MVRQRRMSVEIKSKIVTLKGLLWSNRQIASEIGFSECAVRKFLKNYGESGSCARKQGSGRKKKTTARQDNLLKHLTLRNRFAPSGTLRAQLEEATGLQISDRLVRYRLKEMGLSSRRAAKKPLLTTRMKRKRYEWAQERRSWTDSDWGKVIFSDESKFNLMGSDGAARVRRRKGERYSDECIISTVKHSPYIMLWGCITSVGVGPLLILEGSVNAEKYKKIIFDGAVPALEELSQIIENPVFQDDSAPCHRARSVSICERIL